MHITRQWCNDGLTQLPRVAANWHAQSACRSTQRQNNFSIAATVCGVQWPSTLYTNRYWLYGPFATNRWLDRNNICCCEAVYTVILYRWLPASGPVTTLAGRCFSCAPPFSLLCHLVHRLHAVNASKPMNLGSCGIIDNCIACFLYL